MKKILYSIAIIAASAIAFSSCSKEKAIEDEKPSDKLVTVTFTAEKAGVETKTAAVEGAEGVSYNWTAEDVSNMKLFIVGDDGKGGETLTAVANPTVTKVSDTKLTISGQVAPNATYTFRAVLAGKWTNDGTKPRANEVQEPSATSFDPNADILVSEDKEVVVAYSEEETVATESMELAFRRLAVVNKMTLKKLKEGEKISKVVITSNNNLTGYYDTKTLNASGDKKTITLNYTSATVPAGGQFPVYFTTIPGTGHVLTVEVTTDQFIYTKSFAEGKSIDFNLGQFTKFNFALLAGVANTALVLPVEDDMAWGMTNASDSNAEIVSSDLTATQGSTKKIYDSAEKAYKGAEGLKLGSSKANGSITTNVIDLSADFYVAIDAKTYGSDESQVKILIDGSEVYTSGNLTADYDTYYVNCEGATPTSSVTISVAGKRGYIKNLLIGAGTYVAPPKINVTSSNPLEVANTASSPTITYNIVNPTSATLSASTDAEWITNINYATAGQVTFDVAAQEPGAASRDAVITLAYAGAKSVPVTVSQAAGAGGTSTYAYTFTNKSWNATMDSELANWTSGKDGGGFTNGGIQVTTGTSGANGTSPFSFTDIEEIVVTYCTNSSSGVGSIKVTVGSGTTKTFNVTKPSSGGTTPKTTTFTYSPKESGKVKIEVTCTTNSIYLIGADITAKSIVKPVAHSINCATGLENGSIEADKETAFEGDVVTLTATPASGYKLDAWTVTEATSGNPVTVTDNTFTMPNDDVNVTATFAIKTTQDVTATINFGNNGTKINAASVTGNDSENNEWTITTTGTTSYTQSASYSQVGSSSYPAASITFTTTLPAGASVSEISADFGGNNGTAGDVALKVGDTTVGTGSLNASNDVTVTSTSTASGNVVTVTVTNIAKGVKVYSISVSYK